MKLLVTGAMGHVGYDIVRQAAAAGHDVVGVYRDGLRDDDANRIVRATWQQCDLDDPAAVARLARSVPVDACIHAAAVSNEAFARPAPLAAITTNVGATANLLDAARTSGWRRFVLVSTGSVFQKRADIASPVLEDATPEPANIYSTTKVCAELLTRMYRSEFALSVAIVRISWVFGPPIISESPTRGPIPSYLLRALRGEAIREGGGDFRASFTYIADAAAGLIAAATAAELKHPVYHLGHGVDFTAREAAAAVAAAVPGSVIELAGGTEPWTRYTSIRGPLSGGKLAANAGFRPTYTLATGIKAYADWMRANPQTWRN